MAKNCSVNVRIPQLKSLKKAIEIYYEKIELNNGDIEEIFGKHASSTIWKLKKVAREKMAEMGITAWSSTGVNTEAAFLSWNLDISDLERRYRKLQELAG